MKLTCTTCKLEKTEDDFYSRADRGTYRSECKACTKIRGERNRAEPKPPKMVILVGESKHCAKCNKSVDKAYFHRDSRKSDGLHSYCKSCRSEAVERPESWEIKWVSHSNPVTTSRQAS